MPPVATFAGGYFHDARPDGSGRRDARYDHRRSLPYEDAAVDDDMDVLAAISLQPRTRAELETEFGEVWDIDELSREFVVTAVIPPKYIVRRISDGAVGSMLMQLRPKLFFHFRPSPQTA